MDDQLLQKRDDTLNTLQSSTTASPGYQEPSAVDIANQQRLLKIQGQIQAARDAKLQKDWYGDSEVPQQSNPGIVGTVLDTLQKPLRAVVGTLDYVTGSSPKSSLGDAILYNVNTAKRTFGDVLRGDGVPNVASAPLGFALDIAFDPVNWLTLGSAALVPRVATGLVKGTAKGGLMTGLEAAGAGLESKLARLALTTGKIGSGVAGAVKGALNIGKTAAEKIGLRSASEVPEVGGVVGRELATEALPAVGSIGESAAKTNSLSAFLQRRSLAASTKYDQLVGRDVIGDVAKSGVPIPFGGESQYRLRLGDMIRSTAERFPVFNKYFKYFDYNNAEWTRLARLKDTLIKTLGTEDEVNAATKAFIRSKEQGLSFDDAFNQAMEESGARASIRKRIQDMPVVEKSWTEYGDDASTIAKSAEDTSPEMDAVQKKILSLMGRDPKEVATETQDILQNPSRYVTEDSFENALRLAEDHSRSGKVTLDDLKDIIGRGELGDTGVEWYDNLKGRLKAAQYDVRMGRRSKDLTYRVAQALDGYGAFIQMFKRSKVGASPTAWTNAILGNPTMAWMSGVNILDPQYISRVNEARKIVWGTKGSDLLLNNMLASTDILKTLDANPSLWTKTTGISPNFLNAKNLLERVMRVGKEQGLLDENTDVVKLGKALGYALDDLTDAVHTMGRTGPITAEELGSVGSRVSKIAPKSPSRIVAERIRESGQLTDQGFTSLNANEFVDSDMANRMFNVIERRAKEGNPIYKILDTLFNKASQEYEGIDQSFKLGTTMYATMDGLSEAELTVVSRFLQLDPSDISKVASGGQWRYKLDGTKALELANEIYLNYNAMPAAIRVLRNIPLLGSPFASFMYGMGTKAVKSLAYNPAVYNKVMFGIHEASGSKSPLEKQLLSDPRYAYLNDPAMLKLNGLGGSSFFQTYGLYANLANAIPFYTLNMFTPSERRYKDAFPDAAVQLLDATPLFKDPVGSTIFDFLIQPHILGVDRPVGSFGQPVYPQSASPLVKAGYATRNIVDALSPGILSLGGLVQGALAPGDIPGTQTPITELMPSYRWRQLAYALQGKTSIGRSAKEPSGSRTTRALLGEFGIPVQVPIPFTYVK